MQALCITLSFMLCLSLLSSVISLECDKTQYVWPVEAPRLCCTQCPPGQHMVRRSETTCDIECKNCSSDQYCSSYNVEMTCDICKECNKSNMDYVSVCNATHNAVCKCKAGYRCKDPSCTECVAIPTTTTLSPSTTTLTHEVLTTTQVHFTPFRDTVWFLVIIALLCAGIALLVVTKIKPFLHWIRSNHGYFLTNKTAPQYSEDEEVSKPVQEVCGKCDQPIDV